MLGGRLSAGTINCKYGFILNIQTPGIYMIRKNESGRYIINYADPTQQRNVAELELNHKKVRLSLPEGKEKGKTTSIVG